MVELTLPMPPRTIIPDTRIDAVRGTAALTRGPLVYCLEHADLPPALAGVHFEDLELIPGEQVTAVRSDGIAPVTLTVLTLITAGALPSPARAAGTTLTVNAGTRIRPVTHAASGGLYALAENSRPADSTLLPIKMNTIVQPPPGVGQRPNGQPPGGDGLLVAPQADRTGAAEMLRMPDIYPDFPYRWVSWDDWLAKVDTMVRARLAATTRRADRQQRRLADGQLPRLRRQRAHRAVVHDDRRLRERHRGDVDAGLAYNGGAWSTISYPPTAGWGTFGSTVSTTVSLRAGYNVIRLAKGRRASAAAPGMPNWTTSSWSERRCRSRLRGSGTRTR